MNDTESEKLIDGEQVAHLRRILFDTPLETDEDYVKIEALVGDLICSDDT